MVDYNFLNILLLDPFDEPITSTFRLLFGLSMIRGWNNGYTDNYGFCWDVFRAMLARVRVRSVRLSDCLFSLAGHLGSLTYHLAVDSVQLTLHTRALLGEALVVSS